MEDNNNKDNLFDEEVDIIEESSTSDPIDDFYEYDDYNDYSNNYDYISPSRNESFVSNSNKGGKSYAPPESFAPVDNSDNSASAAPESFISKDDGSNSGNIVDKAKNAAGTTAETAGNVAKGAGTAAQAAGKAGQAAGKGMQAAGKGMEAAGKGVKAASDAAGSALSAIPYVGGVLGGAVKGLGNAAGTAGEVAGKGTQKAGELTEKAGKKADEAGKKAKEKGNQLKDKGKNLKNDRDSSAIKNAKSKHYKLSTTPQGKPDKSAAEDKLDETKDKIKDKAKKDIKDTKKQAKSATKPGPKVSIDDFINNIKFKIKLLKAALLILFGIIMVAIVIIEMIFAPIYDVMLYMEEKWDSISLKINKANNYYAGFGYQTTKEAFYDELDYLYEKYDEQLDIPLLMATLFYKERGTYDTKFGELPDIDDGQSSAVATRNAIISKIKKEYEKMYETTDEDGMNYTAGKIYRLRRLARNQMESNGFLPGYVPTNPETVDISTFIEEVKDESGLQFEKLLESIPSLFSSGFSKEEIARNFYNLLQVLTGEENIDTTSWTNNEFVYRCGEILNSLIVDSYEISGIDISLDGITLTVYRYEASDENYQNYLRTYYIRHMPEFREDIRGLGDAEKEKEIDRIIKGIYQYAKEFDELYGYDRDANGEDEELECKGTIDLDLVSHLGLPVESTSFSFDGDTGYGLVNGVMNNGVNLTASSAGISDGANVKSIADGKVVELKKNNCNIDNNEKCDPLGTYIKIEHEVKGTDSTYKFYSIYTHLKDVSVKKKAKVKKGDVIGHVGSTGDVKEPTLHFEILQDGNYLDPTNLFIECDIESTSFLSGKNNKEKIWCYLTKTLKYPSGKASGTMANLMSESGLEPTRVQGDYSEGYRESKEYTSKVDKKIISKNDFINHGPGGGGYGLAQWTSPSRKEKLYNSIKTDKQKSIGDLEGQLKYLSKEINDTSEFTNYYKEWKNAGNTAADSDTATRAMMLGFERPKDQSSKAVSDRQENGRKIYKEMKKVKCASDSKMNNLVTKQSADAKERIAAYLAWMKGIADDNKHGYSQTSRTGPDYDCSSFVYYAMENTIAGFKKEYPYTTWTIDDNVLEQYGFKRYSYSSMRDKLQPGDIVGDKGHHVTTIYSVKGKKIKQIAAHSNYDGNQGDSSGKEINISDYSEPSSYSYTYVFRLK